GISNQRSVIRKKRTGSKKVAAVGGGPGIAAFGIGNGKSGRLPPLFRKPNSGSAARNLQDAANGVGSAAGDGGSRGVVAGRNVGHSQGAVQAGEQSGLRGHFHFLAFARDNVDGAGGETDPQPAGDVAKQDAHQRAATSANGHADGITGVVVLLLDDFALGDFDVVALLAVGALAGPSDGNKAHLDGDQPAINFNALEHQVQVGLAAEDRKILGLLDRTHNPMNAGAGGQDNAAIQ